MREIDVSSLSKLTEHTLSVNRYDCVMGMEGSRGAECWIGRLILST